MGCASSKVEELPAVLLCRHRVDNLSQALHHRYVLSQAHLSYVHSLQSLGLSLHHFFDTAATATASSAESPPPPPPPQPPVNHRKISDEGKKAHQQIHHENHSGGHLSFDDDDDEDDDGDGSGSHLHFHSSDDDNDDGHDHGPGHGPGPGPIYHHQGVGGVPSSSGGGGMNMMMYDEGSGSGFGPGPGFGSGYNPYLYNSGGVTMNYMQRHVTPSVSYEQRPMSYETQTVQFGDPSSVNNANYYDYFNGGGGGFYGPQSGAQRGGFYGPPIGVQPMKQQEPPPPPPPPPAASGWDFMNFFESIDNHYPTYRTPSRDSREVREEEGIPDLEDEDFDHEVVKEVLHGHQKLVGGEVGESSISSVEGEGKGGGGEGKKGEGEVEEEVVRVSGVERENVYRGRPSASIESAPVEYEVRVVDKVVGEEGKGGGGGSGGGGRPGFRNVFEVVKEIQVQFERAANCGSEFGNLLEVGKLRYHRKNAAYQVSSKMLNVITPSLPSTSRNEGSLDVDEDVQLRSKNLSATLQKLYLWEKKLLDEVKAEEGMRVKHDRKSLKLNRLVEKGAEPLKIEAMRSEVRNLSTKIRIAIQIVDKISAKINKLRDEELWPQSNELIQGLSKMWKAMLECHRSQLEAIDGARGLDALAFPSNPSDTHLEASLQFEHDLLNWTCRFTEWVAAQKGYVRALNGWLMKCILYEPEETADGIAPFSPGRAGAPPIFVICNQWNQSLENISETSEKELIDSMRVFSMMVLHFRERDKGELRQRMTANRDMERKVKTMEKEDMKMQKKMVLASGDTDGLSLSGNVVYQSDTSSKTSLQAGLRHVFDALNRFTADSVKAYEDLLQRSEEVVQEHGRVS